MKKSKKKFPEQTKAVNPESPSSFESKSYDAPDRNIHVLAPKDISKYYGDPKEPSKKSYSSVSKELSENLGWLYEMAGAGEATAINHIVDLGSEIAYFIRQIEVKNVKLIRNIARARYEWPTMITTDSRCLRDIATQKENLELGKFILIRPDKMKFRGKIQIQREVIFLCLTIFYGFFEIVKATRRVERNQKFLKILEQNENAKNSSVYTLLFGESLRLQIVAEKATKQVKAAKRALRRILKVQAPSPDVATDAISKSLVDSFELPELSPLSKKLWLDHIGEFLKHFIGSELEENEVLRPLGDHRGDVEIRKKIKSNAELPLKKPAMRHDPTVNKAIRYRIREKLDVALKDFVQE